MGCRKQGRLVSRHHIHLDLQNVLKWDAELFADVFEGAVKDGQTGQVMTATQVRDHFQSGLDSGLKVIPVCPQSECPNFDYSGGGCPGHEDES